MSRIEGMQKGGRAHLGRRTEAQLELEKLIEQTIVCPADKQAGGALRCLGRCLRCFLKHLQTDSTFGLDRKAHGNKCFRGCERARYHDGPETRTRGANANDPLLHAVLELEVSLVPAANLMPALRNRMKWLKCVGYSQIICCMTQLASRALQFDRQHLKRGGEPCRRGHGQRQCDN